MLAARNHMLAQHGARVALSQYHLRAHRSQRAHRIGRTALVPRASGDDEVHKSIRQVATLLADMMTSNNQIIGLGTGITVNEYIRELSERLKDGRLVGVKCIPSSNVSASEAAFHGVPLTTVAEIAETGATCHLLIDVADEIDPENLAYIVGRGENGPQAGQPSLPRLRELLAAAQDCIVVAQPSTKCKGRLSGMVSVLIEGDEDNWEVIGEELDDIFIGDAEIRRRSFDPVANPRGGTTPVLTEDGNMVLDIQFYDGLKLFGENASYENIAAEIEGVEGVVAHGLVVNKASKAVVAGPKGVKVLDKSIV